MVIETSKCSGGKNAMYLARSEKWVIVTMSFVVTVLKVAVTYDEIY